ncbi:zinc finger domain-containing protein [Aquamicrobium terrae]|uniref:zinc finger domain-containing protein n=1 Tax=Aquamicrobium terrae TaxID=1324945 RepID=UPI003F498732
MPVIVGLTPKADRSFQKKRFRCNRCNRTWPDHPVTRVPCPTCQAPAGRWCRRPSGHRAADLHVDRERAALAVAFLRCAKVQSE